MHRENIPGPDGCGTWIWTSYWQNLSDTLLLIGALNEACSQALNVDNGGRAGHLREQATPYIMNEE